MHTVTLDDYLGPHRATHGHLLGTDLLANAERTVELVNAMLAWALADGAHLEVNAATGSLLTSGWRPAEYNATIPNARPRSHHIHCRAADIYDPDGDIDGWAYVQRDAALHTIGLWLEHPATTRGWCHVQTVAPRSGLRVFYP